MFVDFQNSFLEWETTENSIGRFDAEAVIFSEGKEFILGSEVLACNVYNRKDFFKQPVYKFQPLFASNYQLVYRTFIKNNVSNDSSSFDSAVFKKVNCEIKELKSFDIINSIEIFKRAYQSKKKFQVLIKLDNCQLQFPVKHININLIESKFQIETGPLAILDGKEFKRAFFCCSSFTYAELAVENQGNRNFDLQLNLETGVTILAS